MSAPRTGAAPGRVPGGARGWCASWCAGLALLAVTGCVRMPDSGPVVETSSDSGDRVDSPIFINPRPPQSGDSPAAIVKGFLDAMTATPIETTVARKFLTPDAASSWNPELSTIAYGDTSTPQGGAGRVRHAEQRRPARRARCLARPAGRRPRHPALPDGLRPTPASGASPGHRTP